ncbi:phospho-N-acetylmuramoyl-pentapeptide-transferase [Blattabacterium cuenoti]|uniref:phospho-N-acetylmuramoyl-pentapeptide- transferase n=1 Tax=Blattabacterium cuenoti TaxID=1653831 RepID=UPI001EEAC8A7|nr:phospho-N-acetylmuramoyl-pentapeptide-transferase [Blattabacterium cuenoti]
MAFFFSFIISFISYKIIIYFNSIKKIEIIDNIRKLGLIGEKNKTNVPTMGGIVIIFSTLISTIMFSSFKNRYILILIINMLWIGTIGFIDDYIKIKYNKKGLSFIGKISGQVILGIFIGITMYFHTEENGKKIIYINDKNININGFTTNIPKFLSKYSKKEKEFDYSCILGWYNNKLKKYTWIVFIPIVVMIMIFFSNGSNIADGIDGLTAGISTIIFVILSLFSAISSNKIFSKFFHLIYIPNLEETIVFSFSFLGTLISFLWYNTYPAQIFMGDTGSLTIGSLIVTLSIMNRKEFFLPILGLIFIIENFSVFIQVLYFKFFKTKYGIEKRFFLMAPIHHHFQKLGYHENKIFNRFFIIQVILSILLLILLVNK